MKRILLLAGLFLSGITLTNAQTQIDVGSGTSTGDASQPYAPNSLYSYTQQIFGKSLINKQGTITGLKFYLPSNAEIATGKDLVIWLGHTSLASFAGPAVKDSFIPTPQMTKVFDGEVTNNGGVVSVTFTTPFEYNNLDNIVLAIDENTPGRIAGTENRFYTFSGAGSSAISFGTNNVDVNPDPDNLPANLAANGTYRRTSVQSVTSFIFAPENPCNYPAITSVTGATVCPNTSATLSVAGDPGATFTWYDAETAGNVVGTGATYTTPSLTSTTTYYVGTTGTTGAVQSVGIPAPSPLSTNTTASGVSNVGILFDALVPFNLESVTIYPILGASATVSSLPGTVKIDVLNAAGTIVHTKTVSYTAYPASAPVAQIANLGFPISAGTNYRLRLSTFGWSASGVAGFKIENGVANPAAIPAYPFVLDGIVTLKSGVITAPPTNTPNLNLYHFFYDWKISTKCESPRVPVTATVGCLAVSDSNTQDTVKVYPNPFKDILSITNTEKVRSISIIDAAGRVVKTIGKVPNDLNLSELGSGLYLVNLYYNDGSTQTLKVIKN